MAISSATLDKTLNAIGSTYPIRVGSQTFNTYGEGSLTWTNTTETGYVRILTETDQVVQAGILNVGDGRGYFKQSAAIPPGSVIQVSHQGFWYDMVGDPIQPAISGNKLIKQINLRKVMD